MIYTIAGLLAGTIFGWLIGQLLLLMFERPLFYFFDVVCEVCVFVIDAIADTIRR